MKYALHICEANNRIDQQISSGLAEELQKHGQWFVNVRTATAFHRQKKLVHDLAPDAVVARNPSPLFVEYLQGFGLPLVIVAHEPAGALQASVVVPDDEDIGAMAAEYLLEQEFEHFAGITRPRRDPAPRDDRTDIFGRTVLRRHKTLHTFCLPFPLPETSRASQPLVRWLRQLPKPCAVFAHSDEPGAHIIDVCVRNGIRVPEEVSVLGVDDDPLYCHTTMPNLASVHISNRRMGIEAARMTLDWKPGRRLLKVPPTMVAERASCRAPLPADPLVDRAIAHLRTEVANGVKVRELQQLTGLSSHQLVDRFRAATGRTPMEMILQQRIATAKQLLIESALPLSTIAQHSGFNTLSQFYRNFRAHTGMSPSEYRNQLAT